MKKSMLLGALLSVMALSSISAMEKPVKTGRPLPTPPQKEAPSPVKLAPLIKPVAAGKVKEQQALLGELLKESAANNIVKMKELIAKGADVNGIFPDDTGKLTGGITILFALLDVPSIRIETIKTLLDAGASVNLPSGDPVLVLYAMNAAHKATPNNIAILKLMLQKQYKPNINGKSAAIGGITSLSGVLTVPNSNLNVIRILLDAGADPNIKDDTVGFTALDIALKRKQSNDIIQLLKSRGARSAETKQAFEEGIYKKLGLSSSATPQEILGVSPNATPVEIRKAFQKKAVLWHPDRNADPEAKHVFGLIKWAYDELQPK